MCKPCELHKLVIVPNLFKIVEREKKKNSLNFCSIFYFLKQNKKIFFFAN